MAETLFVTLAIVVIVVVALRVMLGVVRLW
jgi:hypothetical protein